MVGVGVGVAPRAEVGACVRGFSAVDAHAVAVRAAGGLFGLVDAADPFAAVWGRAVQAVGGGQGELGLFVLVALEEVARGVFGDGAVGDWVEAAFGGPLDWVGEGGRDERGEAGLAVEVAGGFDEVFAGEVVEAGDACAETGGGGFVSWGAMVMVSLGGLTFLLNPGLRSGRALRACVCR